MGERLTIDSDTSSTCLNISDSYRRLAFSATPGSSLLIELGPSSLLCERTSEIKEINPIELCEVVWRV